jgi:hypothetical protein
VSNNLTPARARLLGRVGGFARWSRTADRTASTAPARQGLLLKFEAEIREEAEALGQRLTEKQIAQRVEARRREQLARARLARHDKASRRGS